ncbi:uncharacterized protein TNCV_395771 [Trichonephila clavipes]|nr:uncharacterized protein TNCV_395771 [Trichonephila clavipes]
MVVKKNVYSARAMFHALIPNLAPSDFHLVPGMKNWLAAQRFDDDKELRVCVTDWLRSQAAEFYDKGILKLAHRYEKCINLFGDYVEK